MGVQDKATFDGSIDRFKARLVAKDFEQQNGVDYTETFSPVIKSSTVRIVLALAVQFNWPIKQLDISNAFLHGSLMEGGLYGTTPRVSRFCHPDFVCKLHKSIYGLKQAPQGMVPLSFYCSFGTWVHYPLVDSSLFIFVQGDTKIFMLVYVDDILVTGNNITLIQSLIAKLQQQFPAKDLGDLGFFLASRPLGMLLHSIYPKLNTLQIYSIAPTCLVRSPLPLLAHHDQTLQA
jgi:hypothetical protein